MFSKEEKSSACFQGLWDLQCMSEGTGETLIAQVSTVPVDATQLSYIC